MNHGHTRQADPLLHLLQALLETGSTPEVIASSEEMRRVQACPGDRWRRCLQQLLQLLQVRPQCSSLPGRVLQQNAGRILNPRRSLTDGPGHALDRRLRCAVAAAARMNH